MIKEKLKQAQNHQKSYYDNNHIPLEFEEGENMFMRLSPITGVGRALGVRKLSPKFIGPYQINKLVGLMVYQLALPPNLSNIHDVFHVSQLRRYISDESPVVIPDDIEIRENLKTPVGPMCILEQGEKKLRSKVIPMVKLQWDGHTLEEATWEQKDEIIRLHLELVDMLPLTDSIEVY
ncbi:uncharacterized protein LOC133293489 [Gastrolobium bilobum]|uniref:uncharacterized protein LOC133293489 n=1 Tax=Gastrolobium bilobum TaxID=150636 RepID=UPI002AB1F000|nr:uncharacterized protein LOC133293489 [Gastrolobium bilobum]